MDDSKLDKIITGLNACARTDGKYCGACSYTDEGDCVAVMSRDVLAMLKEQDEQKKQILKAVWDVLHEGVSTDTVADQDWVYEQIRNRVDKMY